MSVKCFVDTNILVYARDATESKKQPQAAEWLAWLWQQQAGRISCQVVNEYYVTVTQKLKPGLSQQQARADIKNLDLWQPIAISSELIAAAWPIQDRYGFSWWDSLIVSAAQFMKCDYLLTEDLQHNQQLGGLTVINPFTTAISDLSSC